MSFSNLNPTSPGLEQKALQLEQRIEQLRIQQKRQRDTAWEYVYSESDEQWMCRYTDDTSLTLAQTSIWEKNLLADPKNRLALSALTSNDVDSIVMQKHDTLTDAQLFNIQIPFEGAPITNQRSSGRCWLFASTNIFRLAVMKKHNLKEFELSQAYLFFWDKLEKANYFLTQIIDTSDQELDSRTLQSLLSVPVNDGGQWDMAANLVDKYGLVPQKLYPDSYNAMSSGKMDRLVTTKLREDALILRRLAGYTEINKGALLGAKAKMMLEVYNILALMLGPPPKPDVEFEWEFYDANGKYQKVQKTPLELAQELTASSMIRSLNFNLKTMFSLVNDPRNAYLKHLSVDRLGNVVEGRPISYVNVDMDTIKKAAIAMLRAGIPVFFGSDVGKFSNSASGIMDPKLFDYNLAFNITLGMNKAERIKTGESAMTHAMVLTAVHVDNGKSVRWRVENSWGVAAGEQGWFVMSDDWMDQFVYQIVVDPSFVNKEVRDVLKQEALVLPLWDPMGALAC